MTNNVLRIKTFEKMVLTVKALNVSPKPGTMAALLCLLG